MSIVCLSHVMRHSEATLGARLVLFVLAEHAHDDGTEAYPAIDTICERARLSRRGVQGALRKLEADGMIRRAGLGQHGQTKWSIVMGGAASAPRAEDDAGGRSSRPQGGAPSAPEPTPQPSIEPLRMDARASAANTIFEAWVSATGRDRARTQLTPERRRCIDKAVKAHGVDDCLAAVRNIGSSPDARNGYGRGTRCDDVKHALGDAERMERWRDFRPVTATATARGNGRPAMANAGDLSRFENKGW
jgi:hypothetical protein